MINMASADPVKLINNDSDTAVYPVYAEIYNIGNEDCKGKDNIGFINSDHAEQANVLSNTDDEALFTYYGGSTVPEIPAGSKAEVSFTSDEIPSCVFDKYGSGSANLELAITPEEGVGRKEIKSNEKYHFLDEFGIGQSVKPVPEKTESIHIDDMTVNVGTSAPILTLVTPFEAAFCNDVSYTSSNSCVTIVYNM